MALSGSFSTKYKTYFSLRTDWSAVQNIENNTSTITCNHYLVITNGALSIGTRSNTGVVGTDSQAFTSVAIDYPTVTSKTILLGTTIHQIPHDQDGTKTVTITTNFNIRATISGTWYNTWTNTETVTLDTIPRATTPTLTPNTFSLGATITIATPRASTNFTHTLTYQFGSLTGTIANDVTTSTSWTVPLSLANAIPNAASGAGTITCQTYSGTLLIGAKVVPFTASVPASVVPNISAVSIAEAIEGIAAKFHSFVQNRSMLNVAVTASGAYSSTIAKVETEIQGINYLGTSFVSNLITASGTVGVKTTVTDSRGRIKQVTNNITVLAYTAPTISEFSAYRCDISGNADDEGERIKITVNFNIAPINNMNDKHYEILYKVKGATSWSGTLASGNVYSRNDNFVTSALLSGNNAYDVILKITDYFNTSDNSINASIDIPTAYTLIDFRSTGKGIAFGKVANKDGLEIAMPLYITGDLMLEERHAPVLLNGWTNYGSGYESINYWKDICGVVHISGIIKSGKIADGTVLFNLPEGYRPRASEKFSCISLNELCIIDIYTNGNVVIRISANSEWLSLSSISFIAG